MKLSIIIPVYNVITYLESVVNSILNQSYQDYEVILVDDGSTDGSGKLCDILVQRDSRIKVIHQMNSGVSAARNTGISVAQGEFIGFVDSDDLIEPDMYSILMRIADESRVDIVQCRHNRNNHIENFPREIKITYKTNIQYVKDIFSFSGAEYTNQVALWSKIYRKELFKGIKFPVGQTYEDEQETYKICLKADKIALIDTELYHYVKRENSIITGISPTKMLDKQLALADRLEYLPNRIPELLPQCASSFLGYSTSILPQLWKEQCKEYEIAKKIFISKKRLFYPIANCYQRMYLWWLRIPVLEGWLMRSNFEPLQTLISKVKRF